MEHPWLVQHQDLLTQLVNNQMLPHALLITGVKGAGKQSLARWLMECLVCNQPIQQQSHLQACGHCKHCRLFQNESYPDSLILKPEGNHIGVDEVRAVNQFLQKTAMLGRYKTVIIEQADKMTIAAANALLKTLEEPNANCMLILLAPDSDALLPTIVSRCQVTDIRPPVGQSLTKGLNEPYVNISHIAELNDPDLLQRYQDFALSFIRYLEKQCSLEHLLKVLAEADAPLIWLERVIIDLQRNQQASSIKPKYLSKLLLNESFDIKQDSLWTIYQAILSCAKQVKSLTQVNSQMAIEKLLVEIGKETEKREH